MKERQGFCKDNFDIGADTSPGRNLTWGEGAIQTGRIVLPLLHPQPRDMASDCNEK